MPTPIEASLANIERDAQVRARERAMAEFQSQNQTSLVDSIAAGKNLWADMSLVRFFEKTGFSEDPNFILDDKKLRELSQGVDDRFRVMFSQAKSDEHAQVLRAHALELTGAYNDLANAGWAGKGLGTLAQVISPINVAAGIVTGGIGTAAVAGGAAARLAAAARAGLITGATFGGVEAFRASQDPTLGTRDVATAAFGGALFGVANPFTATSGRFVRAMVGGATQAIPGAVSELGDVSRGDRSTSDYLFAAASNFGMGALFGSIHSPEDARGHAAVVRMAKDAQFADIKASADAAGVPVESVMTKQGKDYFGEQLRDGDSRFARTVAPLMSEVEHANALIDEAAASAVRSSAPTVDVSAQDGAATTIPAPELLAMGAASRGTIEPPSANVAAETPAAKIGDFNPTPNTAEWDTTLLGLPVRVEMGAYLGTSKSSMARMFANAVANDPLPKKGGVASQITADVVAERRKTIASQTIHTTMDGLYSDHVTSARGNELSILTRSQFESEVAKAVRRERGTYTTDPVINKAADFMRSQFEDHRSFAERHSVPGFDAFAPNDSYLTRIGDRTQIDSAIVTHSLASVEQLVARAIQKKTPADLLVEIGKVLSAGSTIDAAETVRVSSAAMAKMWLRNIGRRGVSHELLMQKFFEPGHRVEMADSLRHAFGAELNDEQIKQIVELISPERNDSNRITVARRRISMDETHAETMPNGTKLSIEDLLVNNASEIAERYAHGTIHASMLSKVGDLMSTGGPSGSRPQSIADILLLLKQDMVASNVPVRRMEADLYRAEILLKQVAGVPVINSSITRAIISAIKNSQFVRLMSNVGSGINNFAEIADPICANGAKATLQSVPALGDIFKTVVSGKASGDLTRELQYLELSVATRKSRRISSDVGQSESVPTTLAQMQRLAQRAARVSGDLSLQSYGTDLLTGVASAGIMNRMANLAKSGRSLSKANAFEFAAIGLSESKWARIATEIQNEPTTRGSFGKKMVPFDVSTWKDREAAAWFSDALTKASRRQVLNTTPSERAAWMTTAWGQLLMQLRTFAFGAWTSKTLYDIKSQNAAALFIRWSIKSIFAAVAYAGRSYLQSALMDSGDREKFVADRLSPESIMKAGFSRASWSSLMPIAADTALSLTGRDPAFSFARTSGLGSGKGQGAWNILLGNPTLDWGQRVGAAVTGVLGSLTIPDREFTQDDARALRDALWVPNIIGVKEFTDAMISGLPRSSQSSR